MSSEYTLHDSTGEVTKAERTARDSVPESVEGVASSAADEDGVIAVEPAPVLVAPSITTTSPNIAVVAGSASETSAASADDEAADDLDDASASELLEARRDLA